MHDDGSRAPARLDRGISSWNHASKRAHRVQEPEFIQRQSNHPSQVVMPMALMQGNAKMLSFLERREHPLYPSHKRKNIQLLESPFL